MASYRLTAAALQDLDQLYEYGVLNFGLEQADTYYDGLVARFQNIADAPLAHPTVNQVRQGYRRAAYSINSIYYRIEEHDVVIARILGRQDPNQAL